VSRRHWRAIAVLALGLFGCSALLGLPDGIGFGAPPVDGGADRRIGDEGVVVPPPFIPRGPGCRELEKICGLHQDTSCCAVTTVEAGTFSPSYDGVPGGGYDTPTSPVDVPEFSLDVFEVTVARFRAFALEYGPPDPGTMRGAGVGDAELAQLPSDSATLISSVRSCEGRDGTWTDLPADHEALPINCVSWYEAFSFCLWDGSAFLPFEVEWNYAASGGDHQRLYPWSDPALPSPNRIDDGLANYSPDGGFSEVAAVGSKPNGRGRWSQLDLAGNMAEWMADVHGPYPPSCAPCPDVASNPDALSRAVRGGGFSDDAGALRSSVRFGHAPAERSQSIGFRCLRRALPGDAGR
jgi:formylglycine-generating enzyme required for sulfatase activity